MCAPLPPSLLQVRTAVRKMCESCQIVKRRGKVRVICKVNPKHKQRQPFSTVAAAAAQGGAAVDMSVMSIFDAPLAVAGRTVAQPVASPHLMSVRAWLQ